MSAINPNYILDLNGGSVRNGSNIQLHSVTGSNSQRWNITKYVSKDERINNLAAQNKNTYFGSPYA